MFVTEVPYDEICDPEILNICLDEGTACTNVSATEVSCQCAFGYTFNNMAKICVRNGKTV